MLPNPGEPDRPLTPLFLHLEIVKYFDAPQWTAAANFLADLENGTGRQQSAAGTTRYPMAAACADHRVDIGSQREWTALWRLQHQAAPHLRTHFGWVAMSGCAGWPAKVGNPQHRPNVAGAPPVLILNARHDPKTGYNWATNVVSHLRRSVLVTYDGWGHVALGRGECTVAAVDSYLIDSVLPRPGTHCPAVPPSG